MRIRFRSFTDQELEEALASIMEQKASGVATISQNGETITFRGPAEIENVILQFENEIQAREDAEAGIIRRRSMLFYQTTDKGWL